MLKIKTFENRRSFSCNVYVCSDETGSFIVDPGYFDSEIESYLKTIPPVQFVLLTHGHFDHIMGLNAFAEQYPEAEFYCHKNELQVMSDYRLNASYMAGEAYIPEVSFKTLEEETVNIHKREIKVIYTPGHTIGSCMFYLENEKVVFTGDTLIETSIGRTDLPTGDETEIFKSLKKIKNYKFADGTEFYFGHGNPLKYNELLKYNTFLS